MCVRIIMVGVKMDLIDKFKKIGFIYEDGKVECLSLTINDYKLEVNLENKKINYGNKIIINKDDALNANIPENIVRLECITRLLRQGYEHRARGHRRSNGCRFQEARRRRVSFRLYFQAQKLDPRCIFARSRTADKLRHSP